jgi:tRNA pseudouridine55 synthase
MPEIAVAARPALWLVDKPAGPTSHDVVASVRRRLGRGTKVGHTGTLDPFATGLLVVLVGRATRLTSLMSALDKTYLATLRTGFTSATGDPEGPVEAAGDPASAAAVRDALPAFRGRQLQRVPAHAAVKVGGERLYRRARRGERVEGPEREVEVHDIALLEDHGDGLVTLRVRCSAGTYVRRLAQDLGERIGCGAYLAALRRTAVGELSVAEAVAPDVVGPAGGLDPARGLAHLPSRPLTADELADVLHGRAVAPGAAAGGEGPIALLAPDGRLVAVARPGGAGLRPAVVLEEPSVPSRK